jgi:type II secretory pathway pseudopilin PulG
MKFKPATSNTRVARRPGAFTLAEVLAAMTFMAIVIPAAIEGMHIANRAGVVAQRKAVATRVAERVLNEALLGSQSQGSARNGVVQEGAIEFRWTVRHSIWPEDAMRVVTAEVLYLVQGQEHDVRLSTLVGNER